VVNVYVIGIALYSNISKMLEIVINEHCDIAFTVL